MNNDLVIKNLQTLHDQIALQPVDLFSLDVYKRDEPCGTIFCAVGLAASMPYFIEQGFGFRQEDNWSIATIHDVDVDASATLDIVFGTEAFQYLFEPSGLGWNDEDLGYDDNGYTPNMTDKELALARLNHRIEELKK
jgi:hypothetical protein